MRNPSQRFPWEQQNNPAGRPQPHGFCGFHQTPRFLPTSLLQAQAGVRPRVRPRSNPFPSCLPYLPCTRTHTRTPRRGASRAAEPPGPDPTGPREQPDTARAQRPGLPPTPGAMGRPLPPYLHGRGRRACGGRGAGGGAGPGRPRCSSARGALTSARSRSGRGRARGRGRDSNAAAATAPPSLQRAPSRRHRQQHSVTSLAVT